MAIRTRRGNNADFDPNKLLSGEPATVTDDRKIKWCVAPGDVRTLATVEDMTEAIAEANQPIIEQLTAGANAVANVVEGVLDGVNNLIDSNGKYYTIKVDNGELYLEEIEPDPSPPISQTILDDIADLQDGKVDKTSIVQNTTVNDPNKIPSSAVTYGLQQQINAQNDNLAQLSGLKVEQFYVDQFTPVNKTYANRALLITGRAARGTKGIYYFEPQSGVLTFFENTDLTVTCTDKVIAITNKQATAAYCLLFTC